MLRISNLSKSFGDQVLFENVNFCVNPGEKIGIVGRNGFGKTTLLKMITGEDVQEAGEIQIPKNYKIGHLEQEIKFSKPTIIEEACLGLPPAHRDENWRVEKILSGLGFSNTDMERNPDEFSGGFQLRINLAKTLVAEPDMLLLDEPTNFLDVISVRWMQRYLKSWRGEMLMVTHDRHFIDRTTTHILGVHMRNVRKIEGKTQKFFNQIKMEEDVYEKTRLNEEVKRKQEELFISRFRAKARLAGMVQSRVKALEKREKMDKLETVKSLDFNFRWSPIESKNLLSAQNISFSYDKTGKAPLLQGINFDVGSKERIAVIGKNGKGKSTFLRILAGALASDTGSIKTHPLLKIGHFEQSNVTRLDPLRTIEEEINLSGQNMDRKVVRGICGAMLFQGNSALKKCSVLSGGEKSRVCLGKLIAKPCHMLLLDEPTNHLDPESCEALIRAIDKFEGAVVIITHNEQFLKKIPQRLVIFDRDRQFMFNGGYKSFLDEIGWQEEEVSGQASKTGTRRAPVNRKELKRQRAQLQLEKSRTLRPLEQTMKKLESGIERLEKEIYLLNEQLIEASTNSDGTLIVSINKKIHDAQSRTEDKYTELDRITTDYETRRDEFEEKIKTLQN
ncbi:MAG: ABC-F family ATP-binding cassette domain-containing protein [Fibrobacteria bacterium]|nr:ABC-F family ATP-binding cassette domain-containing protein [Fibrobacteria bacterium]